MDATPIFKEKRAFGAGFVQVVIWRVPEPVPPSEHPFKYRLVYVVDGARVVGYDNERGKGDHKHLREEEHTYRFVDVSTLLRDFWRDVTEASR